MTTLAAPSCAVFCSFCLRAPEPEKNNILLVAVGANICSECARRYAALAGGTTAVPENLPKDEAEAWAALSDEQLLATLDQCVRVVDQANDYLRAHVVRLRARGISWTRIGAQLGISKQAAWERFSNEK